MNSPPAPVLTIRAGGSSVTFNAGHDVVVGRDVRADVRVAHPLVSRAHLLLRYDTQHGRWLAIDNGSLNGVFSHGHRVPMVEITDGTAVNLGNPDGPAVSFEVGRHTGPAGRPPLTRASPVQATPYRDPHTTHPAADPYYQPPPQPHRASYPAPYPPPVSGYRDMPANPSWQAPHPPVAPPPAAHPPAMHPPPPAPPRPVGQPATQMTMAAGGSGSPGSPSDVSSLATRMFNILRPGTGSDEIPEGAITIGRAPDNAIVISDVLASRRHAMLVQTQLGTEIRDNRSINGTFVNGVRVGSAVLTEGDVVTIGNVDLVFAGGTLVRRSEAATRTGGLEVRDVCFDIPGGKRLLSDISLTARPGTLTAIIGGSGAGKTTLSRLIAGYTTPTAGAVTFEGHNIHTEYASLRSRIGMVPQDDVVHRQLTVNQALGYAAELRLPPDTSKEDRDQAVARVLEELELTDHADTRVDQLSGGQRKRASVALELLTGPQLLILDEPTSGLDPALDRQVMLMLRGLADAGRVVLVVTHSVSYLDVCDQILLVAPGGKTAFCGPPKQIFTAMGADNYADIFANVGADPDEANRRFLERNGRLRAAPPADEAPPADLGTPAGTSVTKQLSTVARRQVRLVVSDRWYTIFLAVLPFVIGLVVLTVPGPKPGLGVADPLGTAPTQPQYIMVLLNFGAVFMGVALTIRDLIGERPIFRREQAVGLSTTAYLLAKIAVFCLFAVAQAGVATVIVRLGKGAPTEAPQFFGNPTVSLFVTVAGTCVASAVLGLVLSAFAQTNEQIMPLLVIAVLLQLVLSSGFIPMVDDEGASKPLNYVSWLTPARWGYAAGASSIDMPALVDVPQIKTKDPLWQHTKNVYLGDMAMLAVLSVAYAGLVRWKIRLRR